MIELERYRAEVTLRIPLAKAWRGEPRPRRIVFTVQAFSRTGKKVSPW